VEKYLRDIQGIGDGVKCCMGGGGGGGRSLYGKGL